MKRLIASTLFAALTLSASAAGPDNTVPRDTSFTAWSTYIKVRKKHPEVTLAPPSLPKGVKAYENVLYSSLKDSPYGDRDLHVDIFRPDDNKQDPAMLMIHGGGWNSGDKSLQVPMAQMIAAKQLFAIPRLQRKPGLWVHLFHKNAARVGAVDHPEPSLLIVKDNGVYRVGGLRSLINVPILARLVRRHS